MSDTIEKKVLLDWLEESAQPMFVRGLMWGSFAEQEATLRTLLDLRDFLTGKPNGYSMGVPRYAICRKYRYPSPLSFADAAGRREPPTEWPSKEDQEHFSQVLKDWWEFERL